MNIVPATTNFWLVSNNLFQMSGSRQGVDPALQHFIEAETQKQRFQVSSEGLLIHPSSFYLVFDLTLQGITAYRILLICRVVAVLEQFLQILSH